MHLGMHAWVWVYIGPSWATFIFFITPKFCTVLQLLPNIETCMQIYVHCTCMHAHIALEVPVVSLHWTLPRNLISFLTYCSQFFWLHPWYILVNCPKFHKNLLEYNGLFTSPSCKHVYMCCVSCPQTLLTTQETNLGICSKFCEDLISISWDIFILSHL